MARQVVCPAAPMDGHPHAQTLLLRFLLADADAARAAWREWIAAVDLERLDPASMAVLPGAPARLKELGIAHPALEKLRGVRRHHWYRNRLLFDAARKGLEAMRAAGLAPALAGGAAVLPIHHRDWGARQLSAVDVLVGQHEVRRATAQLARAGWLAVGRDAQRLSEQFLWSSARLTFRDRNGFEIVLRWRVFDWRIAPGLDAAALQAAPHRIDERPASAPSATDLLLLACADDLGAGEPATVRRLDAAALVRGGGIDWSRLAAAAARHALGPIVAGHLAWLAANCDVRVAADTLTQLAAHPTRRADRLYERRVTATGRAPASYRIARHLHRCVTRHRP